VTCGASSEPGCKGAARRGKREGRRGCKARALTAGSPPPPKKGSHRQHGKGMLGGLAGVRPHSAAGPRACGHQWETPSGQPSRAGQERRRQRATPTVQQATRARRHQRHKLVLCCQLQHAIQRRHGACKPQGERGLPPMMGTAPASRLQRTVDQHHGCAPTTASCPTPCCCTGLLQPHRAPLTAPPDLRPLGPTAQLLSTRHALLPSVPAHPPPAMPPPPLSPPPLPRTPSDCHAPGARLLTGRLRCFRAAGWVGVASRTTWGGEGGGAS
jgi:hypothetical protein